MPRRSAITPISSVRVEDATNQDIVDALGRELLEVKDKLGELNRVLKTTHLGHELHLWNEEVSDEVNNS